MVLHFDRAPVEDGSHWQVVNSHLAEPTLAIPLTVGVRTKRRATPALRASCPISVRRARVSTSARFGYRLAVPVNTVHGGSAPQTRKMPGQSG